jgi:hypothetical protein
MTNSKIIGSRIYSKLGLREEKKKAMTANRLLRKVVGVEAAQPII